MKTIPHALLANLILMLSAMAAPVGICLHSYGPEAPADKIECFEFERSEKAPSGTRFFLAKGSPVIVTDYRSRGIIPYRASLAPGHPEFDKILKLYEETARSTPSTRRYLNPKILAMRDLGKGYTERQKVLESLPSITLPNGTILKGCEAVTRDQSSVTLRHADGVKKIKVTDLSDATQKALSIDLIPLKIVREAAEVKTELPQSPADAETVRNLSYEKNETGVTITRYRGITKGAMVIPAILGGRPVTRIGDGAFSWHADLTSVTIPSSVTSIGVGAFFRCSGLASVTIPSSVKNIEGNAFKECTAMNSVVIPSSVTSIGDEAFFGCSGLTAVTIPSSVKKIGNMAFSYCTSMANVTIPPGISSIGIQTFTHCTSLTNVTIPQSVDSLEGTFAECSGLASVIIPSSITRIGDGAFYGCSALKSVTIPPSVTSLGGVAFRGCTGLTSVTIPPSVKDIGEMAFSGCTGLTSVTISFGVTSIGGLAFSRCSALKSVTIPSSVTNIEDKAFSACTNLSTVTFLGDRQTLGSDVFIHSNNTGFYIHFIKGRNGFSTPIWNGYPCVEDANSP